MSPDTSKLKILDLADNALGSRDVREILESIEFLPLRELDLSFNMCGRSVTEQLLEMVKTAKASEDERLLMNSLKKLRLRNSMVVFSVENFSLMFELPNLESVELAGNSCTRLQL